jgi:prephenate dehydrogenase
MVRNIAIIGVGLIGGSLGAAFKKVYPSLRVTGYDQDIKILATAKSLKVIDQDSPTLEAAVVDADVIFIATPVSAIVETVRKVVKVAKQQAIITDVGSTKAKIVTEIESFLPSHLSFVGGHPMAGSEKNGVKAANPDLFKNRHYILTPTQNTDSQAFQTLHSLLTDIGANVLAIDPQRHDQIVAIISHLPHLVAAALVNLAGKERTNHETLLLLAAGGFKDTTRIAAGNPRIWLDICLENKEAILKALDKLKDELERYSTAIKELNEVELKEKLEQARMTRLALPTMLEKKEKDMYELYIPVVDKPGVISDITLAIGQLGINIEDIEILHLTEKSGMIRLTLAGLENTDKAVSVLRNRGYEVQVKEIIG